MEPAWWLLTWVGVWSLVAFLAMLLDKRRARSGGRRLAESNLLLLALVGGSPGIALGMVVARHKTAKVSFLVRFGLVLTAHVALLYWFFA